MLTVTPLSQSSIETPASGEAVSPSLTKLLVNLEHLRLEGLLDLILRQRRLVRERLPAKGHVDRRRDHAQPHRRLERVSTLSAAFSA